MGRRIQENPLRGLVVAVVLVLVLNTLVIFRSFDFFHFPGELTDMEIARQGGNTMIDYIEKLAQDMGVATSNVVFDSIARFKYEVDLSKTPEELAQTLIRNSRQVQEIIIREAENRRNQIILGVISTEPALSAINEKATVVISRESGQELTIEDKGSVLSQTTLAALKDSPDLQDSFSEVVVEIENGKPRVLSYKRLYERLAFLESEVSRLKADQVEVETVSGYRAMSGAGIVVKIYDAEDGYMYEEIVHDMDVRDIMNELMSAGAKGASVGGQRIINTTSIRCVGSVILVNHQPIAVDPVEIQAIGNPEVLASSLEIIKNTLELTKGISIVVEQRDDIVLPSYVKILQAGP